MDPAPIKGPREDVVDKVDWSCESAEEMRSVRLHVRLQRAPSARRGRDGPWAPGRADSAAGRIRVRWIRVRWIWHAADGRGHTQAPKSVAPLQWDWGPAESSQILGTRMR